MVVDLRVGVVCVVVVAGGDITGSALGKDSEVTGPRTPARRGSSRRDGDDEQAGRDGVAAGGDITDSALGEGRAVSGSVRDSEQRFGSSSGGAAVAGPRQIFTALSSSSGAVGEIGRLPLPKGQGKSAGYGAGGP